VVVQDLSRVSVGKSWKRKGMKNMKSMKDPECGESCMAFLRFVFLLFSNRPYLEPIHLHPPQP
jgi:hypothetical protein